MLLFSPLLRAPLGVLIACVGAISAAPAAPTILDASENFKVTTTIANTTLNLDNPRGVPNPFPIIAGSPGSGPLFTGDSVDYDPFHDANLDHHPDHPNTFNALALGDSLNVTHDLKFPDDTAISPHVHDKRMALTPRLNLENCHLADERNKLTGAIWGAHNTFSQAYRSVKYGTPSAYSPWFGVKDSSRKDRVRRNFRRARDYVSLYAYKCGCSTTQERDRDAGGLYNDPREGSGIIRLCRRFFETDHDQQTALILNNLDRLGLHDHARDAASARSLAITYPARAVVSTLNYLGFAREILYGP